jgi:hypothetical protein
MSKAVIEPETKGSEKAPDSAEFASAFYGKPSESLSLPDGKPNESSAAPKAPADSVKADQKDPSQDKGEKAPSQTDDRSKSDDTKSDDKKEESSGHAVAARRLGVQVKDLEAKLREIMDQNKVLQSKLDGTYQEPPKPTEDQIKAQAEFRGRETASRKIAFDLYGKEKVTERIYKDGSEYEALIKEKPWVQLRVMRSDEPAVEAWRILEEESFMSKYGSNPEAWREKIAAEIRPKIEEEIKAALAKTPTGGDVPSVTNARGDGGAPERERSLEEMFYGKLSKA